MRVDACLDNDATGPEANLDTCPRAERNLNTISAKNQQKMPRVAREWYCLKMARVTLPEVMVRNFGMQSLYWC